ncbi:MAG: hypothetical protein HQ582_18070 [Planctomycetes bacterium]|nr:hypothetical protein [Planctomycetota bacterium]
MKLVRRNCLECSGGSPKCVMWCTCDGLHSTRCEFWPFRLGVRPATVRAKYGDRLLTPEKMPSADVDLDELPGTLTEAATGAISVDGYQQPAVTVERKSKRQLSPEERQRLLDQLRRGREQKGEADAA